MLRINKNKKAQGITDAIAVLGSAFLIVIFMILLNLRACSSPPEQKIGAESLRDLKMAYDINAFVKTPVVYGETELTVGNLIVLSFNNENEKENLVNEEPFPTRVFTTENPIEYINALDSYYERDSDKLLTASTIDFMRAYAAFVPAAVSESFYCAISIVAEEYYMDGEKKGEIRIFDTNYQGLLGGGSCSPECIIAETKIPTPDGYASVQMRSKMNTGLIALKFLTTPGLFILDNPCPSGYYKWF